MSRTGRYLLSKAPTLRGNPDGSKIPCSSIAKARGRSGGSEASELQAALPHLIEHEGSCHREVERVQAADHRNSYSASACGRQVRRETRPFTSHQQQDRLAIPNRAKVLCGIEVGANHISAPAFGPR